MLNNESLIEWSRQPHYGYYRYLRESTSEPTGPGVEILGRTNRRYFFLVHAEKYLDGVDLPARDVGGTIIVPPPIAGQPSVKGFDAVERGQPIGAAWYRDRFLGIGDFKREDDPFAGWLSPTVLEAEKSIKWFRNERIYKYVRETQLMDRDHGREIDPYRELEAAEILGIGQYDFRYRGPRRVWYVWHFLDGRDRLDGIDPPCDAPAGGVVVAVDPKQTTIRAGAYSPVYVESERQPTADEIAEAKRFRGRALTLWAENKAENERRRLIKAEWAAEMERQARESARQSYDAYKADA